METSKLRNIIIAACCLTLLIAIPLIFDRYYIHHVMTMMCIWTILGLGWNFIGGYAGQVSNGHSLFYGVGAYAVALSMKLFSISPWISMWIGVLISVVLAFIIGNPLLRLRGHFFAIATMAIAESARYIFLNTKQLGGATGVYFYVADINPWVSMQFDSGRIYYYIYLVFALAIFLLTKKLDKTRFCYYLRTIKSDEAASESIGIDTAKYKMIAYMLSAGIVSLAGSLYAQFLLYIDPSILMTLQISMMIVLVVVMGGIGTVYGPIIGAIVLTFISETTRVYLGKYGAFDLILYGSLVVLIVLFLPGGLISYFDKKKRRIKKDKAVTP